MKKSVAALLVLALLEWFFISCTEPSLIENNGTEQSVIAPEKQCLPNDRN